MLFSPPENVSRPPNTPPECSHDQKILAAITNWFDAFECRNVDAIRPCIVCPISNLFLESALVAHTAIYYDSKICWNKIHTIRSRTCKALGRVLPESPTELLQCFSNIRGQLEYSEQAKMLEETIWNEISTTVREFIGANHPIALLVGALFNTSLSLQLVMGAW